MLMTINNNITPIIKNRGNLFFFTRINLCLLFIIFAFNVFGQRKYPEWFLYPKKFPGLITGFSYKNNSPLIDAEIMYCLYKKCNVEGYLETYESSNIKYLKNSEYYYIYPHEYLDDLKGKLYNIDGICVDVLSNELVSAFSIDPHYNKTLKKITLSDTIKPDWISKTIWIKNGYYYSVGMFTSIGNDNDAWKTSEEHSIFNILTFITTKIYSIRRIETSVSKDNFANYSRIDVNFLLNNIEILERYPDLTDNYFYTLIRIKKSDIISLIE